MDQLTQLLTQLAEKLGTTTEYLWGVLIKQAYINSILNIVFLILTILLGIGLWKVHKWGFKKVKEGFYNTNYTKYEDSLEIPMMIFLFIFIICLLICIINFNSLFIGLINPEYWALKHVLRIIN